VLLEQSPRYASLDLARALADQQEGRIAVQPLDRELLAVGVATVDPRSLGADLVADLRSNSLAIAASRSLLSPEDFFVAAE